MVVCVKSGDTVNDVLKQLKNRGFFVGKDDTIFRYVFKIYFKYHQSGYKMGCYRIDKKGHFFGFLNKMSRGEGEYVKITIPEGFNASQVLGLLNATEALSGSIDIADIPEGSLLPGTYLFSYAVTKQEVVKQLSRQMQEYILQQWNNRDTDSVLLSDIKQLLIVASLIEKEVALSEERPLVASVIYNRLKKRMRLELCSSLIYFLNKNNPSKQSRILTYKDLHIVTPYNLYRTTGLPPEPICMPGRESIVAAMHPAKTDFLFFVVNGTGGHSFSNNFGDHLRSKSNVRQHLNALHHGS